VGSGEDGGGGTGSTTDGGGVVGGVESGGGVGVGEPGGSGTDVSGPDGGGGSLEPGVPLGVSAPPAVLVPLDGPLDSTVGVSDLVLVGDSASQMDGVGAAAADVEDGVLGTVALRVSWAPPATSCRPSFDPGMAQPRVVLDGKPALGS
jgi:hypothetical protein